MSSKAINIIFGTISQNASAQNGTLQDRIIQNTSAFFRACGTAQNSLKYYNTANIKIKQCSTEHYKKQQNKTLSGRYLPKRAKVLCSLPYNLKPD